MSAPEPSEETILEQALAFTTAETREAYLHDACGGNQELRARIESLLQAHEAAGGFLRDKPASPRSNSGNEPPTEQPGDKIGRYKLLEKIGEGGCGSVYLAEQEEPVRRKVALKVIKPGMDSRQVIARFEAERQALALMDHLNIAKFYDAGVTGEGDEAQRRAGVPPAPTAQRTDEGASGDGGTLGRRDACPTFGRPYFVMELVRGIKITDYCDQKQLNTHQRLDLFVQVCNAVQHAHQKGIIHRDLKPSNILVTENDGVPVPKVIDFGIAKATEQKLTDKTLFTQFLAFIGTPAYMSPEQAALTSLDIDTRSDIYSLGVLLYELLTGTTPFDAQELLKAGFDEMRRIIRETEPAKPSTRLTQERPAQPETYGKSKIENRKSEIDKDLDWIVMKCLEKERARRYETANGLAADIQRHLKSEPVTARPPSSAYRFQKLIRRHKFACVAATAVAGTLLFGLMGIAWQAIRANRAEQAQSHLRQQAESNARLATTEAIRSQQVAQFLKDMLRSVGPSKAQGLDTRMLREILEKAAARIGQDLSNAPVVEADLRFTIGVTYADLGDSASAHFHLERALALRREHLGMEHADTAKTLLLLGINTRDQGRYLQAEQFLTNALAIQRRVLDAEHRDTLRSMHCLSFLYTLQGRYAEAERLGVAALTTKRRLFGPGDDDTLASMHTMAWLYDEQGRYEEAEQLYQEGLAILRRNVGDEHIATFTQLSSMGAHYGRQGRLGEAEALLTNALAAARRVVGAGHPVEGGIVGNLGSVFIKQERFEEAATLLSNHLDCARRSLSPDHLEVIQTQHKLGNLYTDRGRYADAAPHLMGAWDAAARTLGSNHLTAVSIEQDLAQVYLKQARYQEVVPLLSAVCDARHESFGAEHSETIGTKLDLATALAHTDRQPEAESILTNLLAVVSRSPSGRHPKKMRVLNNLVLLYIESGRQTEAESLLRTVIARTREAMAEDGGKADEFMAGALRRLAERLRKRGVLDEARARAEEALQLYRDHPNWTQERPETLATLSLVLRDQGDSAGYENLQHEALSFKMRSSPGATSEERGIAYRLADTLYRKGQFTAAESLYRDLLQTKPTGAAEPRDNALAVSASLGRVLADWAWAEHASQPASPGAPSAMAERAREAERLLRDCLAERTRTRTNHWRLADTQSRLGGALVSAAVTDSALNPEARLAKLADAEPLLLTSHDALQQNTRVHPSYTRDAIQRLVRLYQAWDAMAPDAKKAEMGEKWKRKLIAFDKVETKGRG